MPMGRRITHARGKMPPTGHMLLSKEEYTKYKALSEDGLASLRGVGDNIVVVLTEMQVAFVRLPSDPHDRGVASMTTFFLSAAESLDAYQKGHTERAARVVTEVCSEICRWAFSRLKFHNPNLDLNTMYTSISDPEDQKCMGEKCRKHAEKISTLMAKRQ